MRIITISRQFGSGGRELGKRLSDHLGFAYYDREIIAEIAQRHNLDADYVERTLEQPAWQQIPMTFRHSFSVPALFQADQTNLLLEQRKVIEEIAALGKDCILVGRNADVILQELKPFRIFVCADMPSRLQRCRERARPDEHLSDREMEQKIRTIDKNRARVRDMVTDTRWGSCESYHLMVNTSGRSIKSLTPAVAAFALGYFEERDGL